MSHPKDANLTAIVNLTLQCVVKSIRQVTSNSGINPEVVLRCRQRILDACVSAIIVGHLSKRFNTNLCIRSYNDLCKGMKTLWPGSPLLHALQSLTIQEKKCISEYLTGLEEFSKSKISPIDIYECLHPYHFSISEGIVDTVQDKSAQNDIGAYYTPGLLADVCVQKVLDSYLEKRLSRHGLCKEKLLLNSKERRRAIDILSEAKICDFSCGGGRFLVSALRYFVDIANGASKNVHKDICGFAQNLYGIDIDYLSLEVALCELTCECGDLTISVSLRSNFIHGNPLLPNLPRESNQKADLFALRDVYNPAMGCYLNVFPKKFNVIVGNPPWEKIRLEERAFFSAFAPEISNRLKKDERVDAICLLKRISPSLYAYYLRIAESYAVSKGLIKNDPRFSKSSTGELSACALFLDLSIANILQDGRVGLLVKSALATTPAHAKLFNYLLSERKLMAVWDFINTKKIFAIDGRERFSFFLMGDHASKTFGLRMGLLAPKDIGDSTHQIRMSQKLLHEINPLTGMLPNVKNDEDLGILLAITAKGIPFFNVYPDAQFGRLVHYTNHARFISRHKTKTNFPVYEGKFIAPYDGRFSGYDGVDVSRRYLSKASSRALAPNLKNNRFIVPVPRYFIEGEKWANLTKNYQGKYSLMWRSLTSATNTDVCIATILPHVPASQSVQFLQLPNSTDLALLLAIFNSSIFNQILRLKMSGIDLTQSVIRQVPVPPRNRYSVKVPYQGKKDTLSNHIIKRVAILLSDDARLDDFRRELGDNAVTLKAIKKSRWDVMAELNDLVKIAYRCRL